MTTITRTWGRGPASSDQRRQLILLAVLGVVLVAVARLAAAEAPRGSSAGHRDLGLRDRFGTRAGFGSRSGLGSRPGFGSR